MSGSVHRREDTVLRRSVRIAERRRKSPNEYRSDDGSKDEKDDSRSEAVGQEEEEEEEEKTIQSPIALFTRGKKLTKVCSLLKQDHYEIKYIYNPKSREWHVTNRISIERGGGRKWLLEKFHLHLPAEHRLDSKTHEAELHLIFSSSSSISSSSSASGLSKKGGKNLIIVGIIGRLRQAKQKKNNEEKKENVFRRIVNQEPFSLPPITPHWSFLGGLTRPPFDGGGGGGGGRVQWIVSHQLQLISRDDLKGLKKFALLGRNRALQPRNGRDILYASDC